MSFQLQFTVGCLLYTIIINHFSGAKPWCVVRHREPYRLTTVSTAQISNVKKRTLFQFLTVTVEEKFLNEAIGLQTFRRTVCYEPN